MFVLTIDQRGSRSGTDRVPELLAALARVPVVRGFERTVGDEVQGVLDDPDVVVDTALRVLRDGGWSVGIGAGAVDEPLPASPREGAGPAFVLAREAVEAAKSRQRPVPLAVRGADPQAAADADAVLVLIGAVAARRTAAGWRAVDAARETDDAGQGVVARALGVSQQAVSQRLLTALWAEELAARPAAARLLTRAAG
ncbi:hypothetical protein [Cellulomonas xiejunii]|uniref:MarR family transcriptional regulator n=1 Tax=Cellulomonas xiejunii TaxID=2968083 RepID=A0ABY5KWH4_9CELL|nr:hypothetical protein [Cellulomonas xiejunii]MCC2314825.1 hypothetical protein [Cellulomonas xiejunii]MCC2323107.1 hypothetical protein [Cellulomonas xiejunii]UUI73597.1 hypothetical protein NP048_09300 [Cellulomonas xiejunii]